MAFSRPVCAQYHYYEPMSEDRGHDSQGICHRYPPIPSIVMVQTVLRGPAVPQAMTAQCTPPAAFWCGEWKDRGPSIELSH
jgi:hypothetical protein